MRIHHAEKSHITPIQQAESSSSGKAWQRFMLKPMVCQMAVLSAVPFLLLSAPVLADDCSGDNQGNYICADSRVSKVEIDNPSGFSALSVATEKNFSVTVGSGDALTIINNVGTVEYIDKITSSLTTPFGYGLSVMADSAINVDTSGAISGIYAENRSGSGSITINATGDINKQGGTDGYGIRVLYSTDKPSNSASNNDAITINAKNVSGIEDGINVTSAGAAAINITTDGAVVGGTDHTGIYIETKNTADDADISVNTKGSVTGGNTGINVTNAGSGDIVINTQGSVEGTVSQGIDVEIKSSSSSNVTINNAADTHGGVQGILVNNNGTGAITITSTGDAIGGKTGSGIRAQITNVNPSSADISINTAGSVAGGTRGIYALQGGTGAINITTTGSVAGTSEAGIDAEITNSASQAAISINAAGSVTGTNGIYAVHEGTGGAVNITTTGEVIGTNGSGIVAATTNADSGAVSINANGSVSGAASGIYVMHTGTGDVSVNVAGTGSVTGKSNDGIAVVNTGVASTTAGTNTTAGAIVTEAATVITSTDTQTTLTTDPAQIALVESASVSNISVNATGSVSGGDNGILVRNAEHGDIAINALGSVTGNQGSGIYASIVNSESSSDITINTTGLVSGGTNGIMAVNAGTGSISINATNVQGGKYGIFAGNQGSGAINIETSGNVAGSTDAGIYAHTSSGAINITTLTGTISSEQGRGIDAQIAESTSSADISLNVNNVQGGANGDYGISAVNSGSGAVDITTHGTVSGNSAAIYASSSSGPIDITLGGQTHNLSLASADPVIQTYTQTQEARVSIINKGVLTGTVQLDNASNASSSLLNNSGTWNTAGGSNTFGALGTVVNTGTIITAGQSGSAVFTSFDGLVSFTNNGTLSMSNGIAGDTTSISGLYVGSKGTIILDTALGGDNSATDILRLTGGSNGNAGLVVNNVGGRGALTVEGIKVIDVTGSSEAVFTLKQRVVAGPYEYSLYQGSAANPKDGDWYLSSQDSVGSRTPKYRPEVGAYLGNQQAAQNMFMQTLHDRMGEMRTNTEYAAGNTPAAWVRLVASHTDTDAAGGNIQEKTRMDLVQFGQDLARWSANGSDRWHIGVMGGLGDSKTDASAHNNTANAYGKVSGYSVGAYGTWFANAAQNRGLYVDTWLQYGGYKNKVKGSDLPQENYHSHSLAVSAEAGYGFVVGQTVTRQWVVEPQAQLVYFNYRSDSLTEQNGTRVSQGSDNNLLSRVGIQLSNRPLEGVSGLRPFVELNWLNGKGANTLDFNNQRIANDVPANRVQVKTGLQGNFAKNWQVWGDISAEQGKDNFRTYAGNIGVKYSW